MTKQGILEIVSGENERATLYLMVPMGSSAREPPRLCNGHIRWLLQLSYSVVCSSVCAAAVVVLTGVSRIQIKSLVSTNATISVLSVITVIL